MPLDKQVIPIHFGQGINTKTDSKLVVAGKLLRLQDAVFTQAEQIDKRNGYGVIPSTIIGGGSLVSPQLLQAYNNELVCTDSNQLYSYSPGSTAWAPKGSYIPVQSSAAPVSSLVLYGFEGQTMQSTAINANYALYAWSAADSGNLLQSYYTIKDLTSGVAVVSNQQQDSSNGLGYAGPRAVTLGASQLAMIKTKFGAPQNWEAALYSVSSGGISTSVVTFAGKMAGYGTSGTLYPQYDIVGTSTGAAMAYSASATYYGSSTDLIVLTLDTTATVTHTATISSTNDTSPITIHVDPTNGNIWVFWVNTVAGASTGHYAIFTPTLGVVLANTTYAVNSVVTQITVNTLSSTSKQLIYCVDETGAGSGYSTSVYSTVLSSTGSATSTPSFSVRGVDLVGAPFFIGTNSYLPLAFRGRVLDPVTGASVVNPQVSIVLSAINPTNDRPGLPIAQSLYGEADDTPNFPSFLYKPVSLSSTKIEYLFGYALSNLIVGGVGGQTVGSKLVTYDFSASDLNQSLVANNTLLLNGGLSWAYDGSNVTNLGFLLYPVTVSSAFTSGGGSITSGQYNYFTVLEWTDAQGLFYQSAPSIPLAVTVSGTGYNTVVVQVPGFINKSPLPTIALYRTTANSNNAHLITSTPYVQGTYVYSLVDGAADSTINSATPLYTNGGVVENITPPPSLAKTLHNNRVWLIDSENPNTIWYTKTLQPGVGIAFSDLFTAQIDAIGGVCTALAGMDDKLVIFEQRQPLILTGDGPNDLGQGSTLGTPQVIPSDTGCSASKGVQTFPMGVLFKSPKGIYLLDRSLGVKYWGYEVEAYNAQNIVATSLILDRSQIRFLTSAGLTLVYDYIFNQWSTFTNHQGYASAVWQGQYVYARTDGAIYKETPGVYLDNTTAIAPLIRTAWLAMAGVQGFQRVKLFELLGSMTSGTTAGHGVQVSAAYDFNETFSTPIPFTFDAASGAYQYREFLPQQKCDSISLVIQEITTGDPAEYITFTDMSFEAGVKKGANKLTAARSVG